MKDNPSARGDRHGNRARIDPERGIVGENAANAVTRSKNRQTPGAGEENARLARDFSRENQK